MSLVWLWIPATLIAAAAQTGRNTLQRRLTETLGTVGATHVRFLYGLPFGLLFLALVCLAHGRLPPGPSAVFLGWVVFGALSQIAATALMLAAMRQRSFAVVTAYTKTEPVQVALFGLVVLGDRLSAGDWIGIAVATLGVVLVSWAPRKADSAPGGAGPVLLGLAAAALFALAAIGFRGAILELGTPSFLMNATTTLAWSLGTQTLVLTGWLLAVDRPTLRAVLAAWRASLPAGFLGAFASQFWFIGFSLTSAANVRTLALVEVLMAQAVSGRLLAERTSGRERVGMALIVAGVAALLLW